LTGRSEVDGGDRQIGLFVLLTIDRSVYIVKT